MTIRAYVRVSTDKGDQTTENQLLDIEKAGYNITPENLYSEEISGKKKGVDRPEFARMMKDAVAGDTIVCTKTARFGRNTIDILTMAEELKKRKIKLIILDLGMDLTSPWGESMLGIQAIFAQLDRKIIVDNTKSGIRRTQANGTRCGRPFKILPEHLKIMCNQRKANGWTYDEIHASWKKKYTRASICRNIREWEDKLEEYEKEWNIRKKQYAEKAAERERKAK